MNIDKRNISDLSLDDLKLMLAHTKKKNVSVFCYEGVEIIRKYVSLKSRYLLKDLKEKFGLLYLNYLNLFHLIFLEVVKKKETFLDISIINSILSLKKPMTNTQTIDK
jgi:hypothetical protein